ncbi:MAG: futalosine hydrolase, partial [Phycisphaerales bacterium JB039]
FAAVARGIRAEPAEVAPWRAIAPRSGLEMAMSGIGKANAAAAAARWGPGPDRPVICLGVAGALPGGGLAIADAVIAACCLFVDEGVQTDESFLTCDALGFAIGPEPGPIPVDPALCGRLGRLAEHRGPIATVSTCSGTDALARQRADAGAIAEAMEGAAAGLAAWRAGAPFAELRVISNTTGRRSAQRWDLDRALERLSDLASRLPELLA